MPFMTIIVVTVTGLWAVGIVASILAFRWGASGSGKFFWRAIAASLMTLAMGWLCLRRFFLTYSQTTNGKVDWDIDTRHYAVALLLLGALSLVYAIWKKKKALMAPPVIG